MQWYFRPLCDVISGVGAMINCNDTTLPRFKAMPGTIAVPNPG